MDEEIELRKYKKDKKKTKEICSLLTEDGMRYQEDGHLCRHISKCLKFRSEALETLEMEDG